MPDIHVHKLASFFKGRKPDPEFDARIEALKQEYRQDGIVLAQPTRTWRGAVWDSLDKSKTERRFIFKLDLVMLTLASLGYFIKQLDEQNINNAFVSGMKEDLSLFGDELSNAKALYTAGYVIGQIPSNLLLTRINPARWIPFCELGWTMLTLAMYGVKGKNSIYVIRFFIGLFESSFYPGMQFLMGSFYRSDELAKRAIIFHTSGGIGRLFSGILQAAVYTNLNGVHGLAGWRWLFITNFIISLPIALAGFVFFPNLPHRMTPTWIWSEKDIALCQLRMELQGRKPSEPWSKQKARRIFGGWKIWILPFLYMFWNNAVSGITDIMPFWLKSFNVKGQPVVYTVPQINHYPLPATGVTVVTACAMAWISDGLLRGSRWPMQVISSGWAVSSAIILLSIGLYEHRKLHFYLYYSFGCLGGQSGMILSWINELCSNDQEERALAVGAANDFAYLMQIWENLVIWRTSLMPRAIPGTIFTICFLFAQIGWIGVIFLFLRRDHRKAARRTDEDESEGTATPVGSDVEVKEDVEAIAHEPYQLKKE